MNALLTGLKALISEDNGKQSSMRMLSYIVILIVLGNWTYYNISHGTIVPFDWEEITLILSVLGIKGYQKGKEEKVKEVKDE